MIPNACYDEPDARDYPSEQVFGWEVVVFDTMDLSKGIDVQNQWIKRDPSTKMACTNFAVWHGSNCMNKFEWSGVYTICEKLRYWFVEEYKELYRVQYGIDPLVDWAYLSHALTHSI